MKGSGLCESLHSFRGTGINMRCFIAINIDEQIRKALGDLQKELQNKVDIRKGDVKWVEPRLSPEWKEDPAYWDEFFNDPSVIFLQCNK